MIGEETKDPNTQATTTPPSATASHNAVSQSLYHTGHLQLTNLTAKAYDDATMTSLAEAVAECKHGSDVPVLIYVAKMLDRGEQRAGEDEAGTVTGNNIFCYLMIW